MHDDDKVTRFPDGEPVRGIEQPEGASGRVFALVICAMVIGAVFLGYFALKGCAVMP